MSFLITGMGRSGTKFLATMLNRSPSWTVEHETQADRGRWRHTPRYDRAAHLAATMHYWQRHGHASYGQVNSSVRFLLPDHPADVKAVIIRHPRDIVLSTVNRDPGRWLNRRGANVLTCHVNDALIAIDRYVKQGHYAFWFERFTREPAHVESIARLMGIDDLPAADVDVDMKVNARPVHFETWADLPAEARRACGIVDWFAATYYDGAPTGADAVAEGVLSAV